MGADAVEPVAHYEGRFHERPHAHVQDVFVVGHAAVADFEHVEVVPAAFLRFGGDGGVFVEDVHDAAVEAGHLAVVLVAGAGTAGIGAVEAEGLC